MNKFKVGDKVRLRNDLEVGKEYGGLDFVSGMEFLQGKEATIDGISKQGNYTLEESCYFYSEEMLEKIDDSDDLLNIKERFKWSWNELKERFFNAPLIQQIIILIELIILFSWSFGLANGLLATFGFCIFSFLFMFIILFISKED